MSDKSMSVSKQTAQPELFAIWAAKDIWPGCITEMGTRLVNTHSLIALLETKHLQLPSLMQGKCHSHHHH